MTWKIASAKQQFSEVVRRAAEAPQVILRRNQPVAAIIDVATFSAFQAWQRVQGKPTIADALTKLRQICVEDAYELEIPAATRRPNAFAHALDEIPD